ncbi:MAG: flagellar basal body P-ring protein FlgI, partial [Ignavibacteria bacterium]
MKKGLLIILVLIFFNTLIEAQRIKDIAYIGGSTSIQVFGYGMVVGLDRTGDSQTSGFTVQSIASMLKKFGITVPERDIRIRNAAAVMVTATINTFLKPGAKFDVTVSSIGDARSLQGGTLLLTPLTTIDGQKIIGFAQGPLSVGGFDYRTPTGSRVAKNHVLTGRVPQGGIIQEPFADPEEKSNELKIFLKQPDITTINNIVAAVNQKFSNQIAKAVDPSEVVVSVPTDYSENIIGFMADLESIQVESDYPAKVVLNERTGTVVAGASVQIKPITIS